MAQILNAKEIARYNFKNKVARQIKVYNSSGKAMWSTNKNHEIEMIDKRQIRKTISKASPTYKGSAAYYEMWNKIESRLKLCKKAGISSLKQNITHYPAGAEDLFDLLRKDITARVLEMTDWTPFIANIEQNDNFTNPYNPQWLYKYVAPFGEITGRGDPVRLVQIKTGAKESMYFTIEGVGFEQDLYNQLFNDIFEMRKVTEAIAEGYVLKKNDYVFNPIFNFGYGATKVVAAVTAYTYEQNLYDTIQNAIETLGLLQDFQTGENIDILSGLTLICHSTRVRGLNRSLNGELRNGSEVKNLSAVKEITRIIPYNTKYQNYGNERIEYEGCARNVAYLCVPHKFNWLALKRDLTHVTGPGDTFGITSDRESWYFVPSVYNTQFFGGDENDPLTSEDPTVMTQAYGYIVAIELPDVIEEAT